jgi:hypothetical protein
LLGTAVFLARTHWWSGSSADDGTPSNKSTEPARQIRIGEYIIARWSDDCLYSATILKTQRSKYFVHYDFMEESWIRDVDVVETAILKRSDLPPGTKVYAKPNERQSKWLRSIIIRHERGKYLIAFEQDKCLSGATHMWVAEDQLAGAS